MQTETKPEIVTTLKELVEKASAKRILDTAPPEDRGLAEPMPFPFLALVGQAEMKIALLLTLINPAISGVLLIGPRGTGKPSAVRGLLGLLPLVERSNCAYGCLPEDIEVDGLDAVCPDCAKKYGEGQPLTHPSPVQLVELPLNARIEDVVGGLDDRAAPHARMMIRRGILSRADRNLLYIDEVNLLTNEIVDAILDAAAQGIYTVRRGPVAATYRARFVLIGSMNPEEGRLRPQILDRFGLRLIVHGLTEPAERLEAYRRTHAYFNSPRTTVAAYADETLTARADIEAARRMLPKVELTPEAEQFGLELVRRMQIDSLRAEITMYEAARAYAAADNRLQVTAADMRTVAPLAVRLRRSAFMLDYFKGQQAEEKEIKGLLEELVPSP
jgi:magnesium chelatase subunit I